MMMCLKSYAIDFESKVKAFSMPGFGANVLGTNPSESETFQAFI